MDSFKENGGSETWIKLTTQGSTKDTYFDESKHARNWQNTLLIKDDGDHIFENPQLGHKGSLEQEKHMLKAEGHKSWRFFDCIHKLFFSILDPHKRSVKRLKQMFAISCLFGVFVDPLFFFIFEVKQMYLCIAFDQHLAIFVTILRTITDSVYLIHMLFQFRLPYIDPGSDTVRAGDLVFDSKLIAKHYLRGWFLFDLLSVLPVPQVIIWNIIHKLKSEATSANYAKSVLRVTVLIQYIPRCIRSMPFVASNVVFETAKANFIINLFMYLLAGHVVGACWYLFGMQRVNECLIETCAALQGCKKSFLDCGNGQATLSSTSDTLWFNNTEAEAACINVQGAFDFGIYATAVPLALDSTEFNIKYTYSLFWGVQQLSTLAGNLVPSEFEWEVLFSMGVILVGLLLLALLIGNMQNFLQSLGRRKMDMQLKRDATETWMTRRKLPLGLKRRVREAERFKWAATRGINEDNLILELTEDLQREIYNVMYSKHLRKVYLFSVLDDTIFEQICERLHPKFYIKNSIIMRNHYPVERMLFIVRGKLESIGKDGYRFSIKEGDFCGEELLSLCDENLAPKTKRKYFVRRTGQKAMSSRTVTCLTDVEAFALEAVDLEYVTTYFSRNLRKKRFQGAIRYQSPYWRSWAAGQIQAAWRYYIKRRWIREFQKQLLAQEKEY